MKILIVDDEQLARQRMHDLVSKINDDFEILEADNGKNAIESVEQYHPDTIIMDIRMPSWMDWRLLHILQRSPLLLL